MSLISRRTFCLMVFGPTLLAAVLVTFLPTSTNAKIAGDDGILKLTQGNFETQFPRIFFIFSFIKSHGRFAVRLLMQPAYHHAQDST